MGFLDVDVSKSNNIMLNPMSYNRLNKEIDRKNIKTKLDTTC